jgi:phosphate transport system protein
VRDAAHRDLAELGGRLATMCARAGQTMRLATLALLTADLVVAERLLAGDAELDQQRADCQDHADGLLPLPGPVAGGVWWVLAAAYGAEKIARMGQLAAHVADAARCAHPKHAVPVELEEIFAELGTIAADMADRIGELITSRQDGCFAELEHTAQRVDALHAALLARITGDAWTRGAGVAAQVTLLAGFYQRFADQALGVAKRLDFASRSTMSG